MKTTQLNLGQSKAEMITTQLEKDLETMELRLLEAIWSLERATLDQYELIQKVEMHLNFIGDQFMLSR